MEFKEEPITPEHVRLGLESLRDLSQRQKHHPALCFRLESALEDYDETLSLLAEIEKLKKAEAERV